MVDPKQLGNRIKALRINNHLSQEKLAENAGLNGKYLGEVERGKANISILNLSRLADVLHLPLLSLLTMEHERSREMLISELTDLLGVVDDRQLKIIYRIVEAVAR
ncbi:MAG: helix-turn-helix domain-containing protein [Desulfovibrio sp.]|jgi:transcriptional regulator with XRE-family HTH domain|nr:helix-turn-helix domain-containing protein [Desulfovibrio sp.]